MSPFSTCTSPPLHTTNELLTSIPIAKWSNGSVANGLPQIGNPSGQPLSEGILQIIAYGTWGSSTGNVLGSQK